MIPRGIAIAMPIFKAWFDDPGFEAGWLGLELGLVCVGTVALAAVDVGCVEVDLAGEERVEGAASLEEGVEDLGAVTDVVLRRLDDETDVGDVADSVEGRLVWPGSRSTTEKGKGWRLVGFALQQSPSSAPVCPGMPAQHQLLSPQWLTSVKPPNSPETRSAGTENCGSESTRTFIAEG